MSGSRGHDGVHRSAPSGQEHQPKPTMCPCMDAHRRLMDFHEDIHRVIENYLDANEFRRFLNSALQNSRSVSFLVQKRKAKWTDFDIWYLEWQREVRTSAIARWAVESRNRIVKEEDLRMLSQAIITFYGERLSEAEDVLTVAPDTTVEEMVDLFAHLASSRPADKKGWIRIRRRWVDDQLPDHELVAALREVYASVARLIEAAHEASGVARCLTPPFRRGCVTATIDPSLACLGGGDPLPAGMIDVATGSLLRLGYGRIEQDEALVQVGRERYGFTPKLGPGVDAIAHADSRLELSKRFLEADGYAGPTLTLFRGDSDVRINPVFLGRNEPREFKVAATVEMHGAWPFDSAVFASEMWLSRLDGPTRRGKLMGLKRDEVLDSNVEFFDPDPIGDRDDALMVQAIAADGRSRVLIQPFARSAAGIVYGPMIEDRSGEMVTPFLRPVWRTWSRWKNGPPHEEARGADGP